MDVGVGEGLGSSPDVHDGTGKPTPPPESPAAEWSRRWIIVAFWTVVACLGLPHWIWTTSIHRSDLPLETMNAWAEGKVSGKDYVGTGKS